jgi:uncharacterized protein (TIGR02246 family)
MMRFVSMSRCVGWSVAVAALLTLGCVDSWSEPDENAASTSIDRTLAEWAQAFERGDSPALVALVTQDAEFWTHGDPPITGRTELEDAFDGLFAQFTAVQRFDEMERTVAGDFAILRGEEINTLTPKAGGQPTEYRQRAFSVLRRENDGRWRFWRGMTNEGPVVPVEAGS